MRIIAIILVNLILFLTAKTMNAQSTPVPPKKPLTVSVQNDDVSSLYSYSKTDGDESGRNKNTNVSVSISSSDDSYSFRAKYPSSKYKEVKSVLEAEMSRNNLSSSKGKDIWISDSDDEEVYKVVLSTNKLSMVLDKDIASSSLIEKFDELGKTLRTVIAGPQNDHKRDAERMQREADRLRRDAERMQREADRMIREAKRHERNVSNNYKEDARRISEQAERIAAQATDLNKVAGHKGGISSSIRGLLGDDRTYYADGTESAFGWNWPNAQKKLVAALKEDRLIHTDKDFSFTYDDTGMYANGTQFNGSQLNKYKNILSESKLAKGLWFSFYKGDGHIVIINNNADVEGFFSEAKAKGIIPSGSKKKVKFEINGNSVVRNGEQLASDELSSINKLLLQNKIIPAPGQLLEISGPDNYQLGYKLSDSGFMGTWRREH